MKRFALADDYRELYEKVVPPISIMQASNEKTQKTCLTLQEIVAKYDENLCTKANKQDMMIVDNKFRNYVLKDKYKVFKEKTEKDYTTMKVDVNHVVTVVAKVTKNLPNDI